MLSLNGKWKVTHVPYCSPIDFILSPSFVPEAGWMLLFRRKFTVPCEMQA